MIIRYFFLFSIFCTGLLSPLQATYLFKNGRLIDLKDVADKSVQEHYNLGIQALKEEKWEDAISQFRIVTVSFPDTELAIVAYYYLGVAYYQDGDVDLANRNLSIYLQKQKNPTHYIETFQYKLAIANAFRKGAKKHLFDQETLPQLFSAYDEALAIYDEIINSLPNHELGAKALYSKAALQKQEHSFKASLESYQAVIKKFPKTEIACRSYIKIAKALFDESELELNNPDLLTTAEINLKKFTRDFPKAESEIVKAKKYLHEMKELYATGLYEIGQFYERKSAPKASILYYHQAITQFPETKIAGECKDRLLALDEYAKEMKLPNDVSTICHSS